MPKKAKSKAKSKAKLNLKKSKKGRRAAPPKRRKVAVSIPALEAAATEAADFAAKHEAAAAESKGAAEQRRSATDAAMQEVAKLEAAAKKAKRDAAKSAAAVKEANNRAAKLDALAKKARREATGREAAAERARLAAAALEAAATKAADFAAKHEQRRGPRVGFRARPSNNRAGRNAFDRPTGSWIEQVAVTPALANEKVFVTSRCRKRLVAQLDRPPPALPAWVFELHGPRSVARWRTNHSQVAPCPDHRVADSMRMQLFNGAINGIPFRDRIEIERNAVGQKPNLMFPRIKLHQPITDARARRGKLVRPREAMLFPEKTPKLDHRTHRWIKRAPGITSHLKRVPNHRRQLVRH